ncbi:MAG: hypothetical protein ACRDL6_02290 [Solirubrobacterales bacterium]
MRLTAIGIAAALACAPTAAAQSPDPNPTEPFAPWDGTNPFKCALQDAGTGATVPDPGADPYCVEFDKTQQNVTDLGIFEFLANEPGRVAAAVPKCFYYQSDHWTASVVQGNPDTETWHWDGQYFFDKARGVGGVNVQNFRILGQPASPSEHGEVPPEFAPYMDQGGGGSYVFGNVDADPQCAARVDTPEEQAQIYSGSPPPVPASEPAQAGGSASTPGRVMPRLVSRGKRKCKKRGKKRGKHAAEVAGKKRCKKRGKRKKRKR